MGGRERDAEPLRAALADFVLEGLCALKKISRSDEGRLLGTPGNARPQSRPDPRDLGQMLEDDDDGSPVKKRKKYYN